MHTHRAALATRHGAAMGRRPQTRRLKPVQPREELPAYATGVRLLRSMFLVDASEAASWVARERSLDRPTRVTRMGAASPVEFIRRCHRFDLAR